MIAIGLKMVVYPAMNIYSSCKTTSKSDGLWSLICLSHFLHAKYKYLTGVITGQEVELKQIPGLTGGAVARVAALEEELGQLAERVTRLEPTRSIMNQLALNGPGQTPQHHHMARIGGT